MFHVKHLSPKVEKRLKSALTASQRYSEVSLTCFCIKGGFSLILSVFIKIWHIVNESTKNGKSPTDKESSAGQMFRF